LEIWGFRSRCAISVGKHTAKRVTAACREVRERHLVGAAYVGIDMVNLAGEAVWRKSLGDRVGVQDAR
jgi:hypothetical protein